MGLYDLNLQFSNAQAITASAQSTNAIDLATGLPITTTFTPSPDIIDGNVTYFGEDLGLGRGKGTPRITIQTGSAAFLTGTSLQVGFRGAPLNSTAFASGLRSDLTFAVYIETDAIAVALLTAYARIASFDWPKRKIGQALPRFVDLYYTVAGSNFTAGTLTADISLGTDDAQGTVNQYAANY